MNAKGDKAMKGYKGFDKDLSCRGFQYEIGKTYECEGKITLEDNEDLQVEAHLIKGEERDTKKRNKEMEQSNYCVRFDTYEKNDKCYVDNELNLCYEPTLMTKSDAEQLASDFEESLDLDIWGGSLERGLAKVVVEKF